METQNIKHTENELENSPQMRALRSAIFSQTHPDAEKFGEYVLGSLPVEEVAEIDSHTRICAVCMESLNELTLEMSVLDSYLESKIVSSERVSNKDGLTRIFTLPIFRYAAAAVVLIGVFYSSLSIFPEVFLSKKYILGNLSELSSISITRGLEQPQLQEAQYQISNKDYEGAIKSLLTQVNTANEDAFYINYLLGLTYLHASSSSVAGVIPDYNKSYLELSKNHLLKSIELNTNSQFKNISLDAYYFAAKSAILLGSNDEARQFLSKVVEGKGSMMDEAKKLLNNL